MRAGDVDIKSPLKETLTFAKLLPIGCFDYKKGRPLIAPSHHSILSSPHVPLSSLKYYVLWTLFTTIYNQKWAGSAFSLFKCNRHTKIYIKSEGWMWKKLKISGGGQLIYGEVVLTVGPVQQCRAGFTDKAFVNVICVY